MRDSADARRWTRHFFYRAERTRTTWKFRIALVAFLLAATWLTRGWWTVAIGRSLVCQENLAPSDAILIENFDPSYLLFERARNIREAGLATRVLVPVPMDATTSEVKPIELATSELMVKLSRLGQFEVVKITEVEPISLNAARDVQRYLQQEGLHSVIVVSPIFRSRRSALVYGATFSHAGITVRCEPVRGTRDVYTWSKTTHGVQEVTEQWIKLQYYRFYLLPWAPRDD